MWVPPDSPSAAQSLDQADTATPASSFFERSLVTDFTFRLRYLGFGLYWAWMTTFWTGTVRSPLSMPTLGQTTTARIAVQAATTVAFILAALFARRLTHRSGETLLILGGTVLGPLGTIVAALGQTRSGGVPFYLVFAWVSLGVACACITLLWGHFFASIGLKRASLLAPLSLVLAAFAGLVLSSMQPLAALVLTTLLPLCSVGLYVLAAPEPPAPAEQPAGHPDQLGALRRICLVIAVYSATLGFYLCSQTIFPQGGLVSMTSRLVALVIPLAIIVLLRHNDFGVVFRIALPLTTAGFLLLPLLGTDATWIAVAVVAAGGTFADILTWIALSDIAYRGDRSPIFVFGVGRAANAGGIALGWAASYALLEAKALGPSPVLGFCLAMVFALILTTTLIMRDEDFAILRAAPDARATVDDDPAGAETRHGPGRWRRSCARIARDHDLSPREEEVLVLLAKGRSMKHIEETLVISYHTAKAHANHVYRKLGVHSREELIELVEEQKQHVPPTTDRAGAWAEAGLESDPAALGEPGITA